MASLEFADYNGVGLFTKLQVKQTLFKASMCANWILKSPLQVLQLRSLWYINWSNYDLRAIPTCKFIQTHKVMVQLFELIVSILFYCAEDVCIWWRAGLCPILYTAGRRWLPVSTGCKFWPSPAGGSAAIFQRYYWNAEGCHAEPFRWGCQQHAVWVCFCFVSAIIS